MGCFEKSMARKKIQPFMHWLLHEGLEHFHIEITHCGKMLWRCGTKSSKAREIFVGGLCPPLSGNLKRKML
jgi:hypothetical protein